MSAGKKRKRSCSSTQSQPDTEEKAKAVSSEAFAKLTHTDLMCPICFDLLNEVYVTQCGHSFCFQCISKVVTQTQQCPVCKAAIPGVSALHPNCFFNDVVAKFKTQTSAKREATKGSARVGQVLDIVLELSEQERCAVVRGIAEQCYVSAKREVQVHTGTALHFLSHSLETKKEEMARIEKQLEVLSADRDRLIEKQLATEVEMMPLEKEVQAIVPLLSSPTNSTADQPSSSGQQLAGVLAAMVAQRIARVDANFDEFLQDYFSVKLPTVGEPLNEEQSLEQFCSGLRKFTRFQKFKELATLTYGDPSNCCIVSSIEFDKDGEFFAVAGAEKLKVFEFDSVVRNSGFINHFPVHDMSCTAKLSCVAYNPYHKHHLLSSDYEGSVCVWDTNIGQRTRLHKEHSRRVWSVSYCQQEPTIFASGSDDCTVKLWSVRQPHSLFSLPAKAIICSVKFNPHCRYLLAYGSADHGVHYIDLRNPTKPLQELMGHKEAVTYVDFIGSNELVSASTDSELKCWQTQHGTCLRTYRGHVNNKNFVGLTVTPDFIACGSENNAVYVYAKQVSSPMLTYQYNSTNGLLPREDAAQSPEPGVFVSAVSWRGIGNTLIAANSQGQIKVLEMSTLV